MRYFKHVETINGLERTRYFQPEGTRACIPPDAPDNSDYARMTEEVAAGTSTIEEIDDTA